MKNKNRSSSYLSFKQERRTKRTVYYSARRRCGTKKAFVPRRTSGRLSKSMPSPRRGTCRARLRPAMGALYCILHYADYGVHVRMPCGERAVNNDWPLLLLSRDGHTLKFTWQRCSMTLNEEGKWKETTTFSLLPRKYVLLCCPIHPNFFFFLRKIAI